MDNIIEFKRLISEKEKELIKLKKYWFLQADGTIGIGFWENDDFDHNVINNNNMYFSEDSVQFAREKKQVISYLETLAIESEIMDDQSKSYFYLGYADSKLHIIEFNSDCQIANSPAFRSRERAESAVKEIGEDRIKKYLFGGDNNE